MIHCSVTGKERQFLRDFVSVSQDTSGGRLARWLQPESVVDPTKSQLIFPGVFSASLATFGASNSASIGVVGFRSPIKTVEKGDFEPLFFYGFSDLFGICVEICYLTHL